jgi:hypothetical protein
MAERSFLAPHLGQFGNTMLRAGRLGDDNGPRKGPKCNFLGDRFNGSLPTVIPRRAVGRYTNRDDQAK